MKGVNTKRERDALAELFSMMQQLQWDLSWRVTTEGRLPKEWGEIWRERSCAKERVTIRVDRDVLRYFKSMGDGYGPRMNRVLRAFMAAQLSGLIENEDLPTQYREAWMGEPRPRITTQMAEVFQRNGLRQGEE